MDDFDAAVQASAFSALAVTAANTPRDRRSRLRSPARWLFHRLPWLLLGVLFFTTLQPRAWDAQRMLAAAQRHGPEAVASARALQAALMAAADLSDEGKLAAVNEFYNRRIQFREDIEVWSQVDYWASPLELLNKGQGDCEDFAIAKYFALMAIGMPMGKLRLVYVRAQLGGPAGVPVAHMVLAYYPSADAEPLILDNLITDVRQASRRSDLAPVFSFNSDGLWQGVGGGQAGSAPARLSRWRDVLAKARQEGFQ